MPTQPGAEHSVPPQHSPAVGCAEIQGGETFPKHRVAPSSATEQHPQAQQKRAVTPKCSSQHCQGHSTAPSAPAHTHLTWQCPSTPHQRLALGSTWKGKQEARRQSWFQMFHSLFEVLHATSIHESCTFRTGLTTRTKGQMQTQVSNQHTREEPRSLQGSVTRLPPWWHLGCQR